MECYLGEYIDRCITVLCMQVGMPKIHIVCRDGGIDELRRLIERERVNPRHQDRVSNQYFIYSIISSNFNFAVFW